VTPQFKSFRPVKGPVGTQVQITGVSLMQTTAVSFNGVAASEFTVDSGKKVTVTVPTDATTGTISITTAGGTATSVKSFKVTRMTLRELGGFLQRLDIFLLMCDCGRR